MKPAFVGKMDIRAAFPEFLQQWGIDKSVDEMFEYWWSEESTLENRVLDSVRILRSKGYKCYLASDQERNRGEFLMNELGLKNQFDGAFFSYELGMQKHDPNFFTIVISSLNVLSEEIVYWDDDPMNVSVAESAGIQGKVFESFEQYEEYMKKLNL